MKKIVVIARAELSNLFFSPIAWLLLIIFLIQCCLAFVDATHLFLTVQQLKKLYSLPPSQATLNMMTEKHIGMFTLMINNLYLYLPLLTMGLISREVNSGTIRLLYSSPVRTEQIVLGKFLAMTLYNLLLVAVLGIFAAVAAWGIPHADTGMLLSCLLGFFLLLGAYAAIGLFMSCLTSYQVVAALSTLAVFAALHYIGFVWQDIDFVRDLTGFLSLGSRTESMLAGLITSGDVLYFIIIMVLFLGFSLFRLQADQESRPLWARITRYAGLLVLAVGLGYLTSRPGLMAYADVTAPKTNTIAPATQALLQSTGEEPLELTAYVNLMDHNYRLCSPQVRHDYLKFWEPYVRYKPGIRFQYVYYYDTTVTMRGDLQRYYNGRSVRQIAEEFAKTYHANLDRFITPEESRKIPGLRGEHKQFVMQVKYKGRTTFLRVYDDQQIWPTEDLISAAFKRVIEPGAIPKIGFLAGGLERSPNGSGDRGYSAMTSNKSVRFALINNGFDVATVDEGEDIPSGLTALVIADPKVALSTETMGRLQHYIAAGGNLLITGEPGKQPVLNPLLLPMGVELRDGILVQRSRDDVPDMITPSMTPTAANMSQGAAQVYYSGGGAVMSGAAAIQTAHTGTDSVGRFRAQPLLITDAENSWLKMGRLVNDSAAVEFNAADGDEHGNFIPAMALTRMVNGHEQRIAVTGDADFMSDQSIKLRFTNTYFCSGLFKWFSGGVFPVELSRAAPKDLTLAITDGQLSTINILFVWVLPGLLLAAATVLLIRRKRK